MIRFQLKITIRRLKLDLVRLPFNGYLSLDLKRERIRIEIRRDSQ